MRIKFLLAAVVVCLVACQRQEPAVVRPAEPAIAVAPSYEYYAHMVGVSGWTTNSSGERVLATDPDWINRRLKFITSDGWEIVGVCQGYTPNAHILYCRRQVFPTNQPALSAVRQ